MYEISTGLEFTDRELSALTALAVVMERLLVPAKLPYITLVVRAGSLLVAAHRNLALGNKRSVLDSSLMLSNTLVVSDCTRNEIAIVVVDTCFISWHKPTPFVLKSFSSDCEIPVCLVTCG